MNEQNFEIDMIEIGKRIKDIRTKLQITHKEIYEKCGISSGSLSMIENGKRIPTIAVIYKIASILDCSVDWLITGHSPNKEFIDNDEKKLLDLYQSLNTKDQKELLALAQIKSELN